MHLKNKSNEYQQELGELFDLIPKSVLAAIAVSSLTGGGDWIQHAKERVATEWDILFLNGIVSQKPPSKVRPFVKHESGEAEGRSA